MCRLSALWQGSSSGKILLNRAPNNDKKIAICGRRLDSMGLATGKARGGLETKSIPLA